jgi:hypothetical protein
VPPEPLGKIVGVHGKKYQVEFPDKRIVGKNHGEIKRVDDIVGKREQKTTPAINVYVPEKILDEMLVGGSKRYLVKWEGYAVEDSTWEPVKNLARLRNPTKKSEPKLWQPVEKTNA